jgi:RNA polymerase sigma-70 factor (ECF subfamily)
MRTNIAIEEDAELVAACLSGGPADDAFRELVRRHKSMVMCCAFGILKDHHEAEDVSQDAFVQAFRSLGSLRDGSGFGSWVISIARNAALDRVKRRRRHPADTGGNAADDFDGAVRMHRRVDDPQAAASRRELHGMVLGELEGIPEQYRRVIHLRYVSGHSCAEIAQIEGTSVNLITCRLTRATAMLREKLARLTGGTAR